MDKVAAIVLAAGTSSRFSQGSTKLVANFEGKPLVRHAVDAAMASLAFPVIVVTGHAREDVRTALHGAEVVFVHNRDYATGIASSLRSGLASLPSSIEGAVICLADMPRVTTSLIDLLIVSFGRSDRAHAIVPVHNRRRGNPVLVARALFEPIAMLTGDEGAKRFLNQPNTKVVEALVEDAGVLADIDTREALDACHAGAL